MLNQSCEIGHRVLESHTQKEIGVAASRGLGSVRLFCVLNGVPLLSGETNASEKGE